MHCKILFCLIIVVAGAATWLPAHGEEAEERAPSFLFILVDDLGWIDLACCGSTFYETPNLDRLAAGGIRFTQAYASCPVCSPTRASILTGKHPARLGITDWIPGNRPKKKKLLGPAIPDQLPLEEVTLAERLKKAGYRTFFAGKWHLGGEGFLPEQQGFEWNKGGFHKGSPPGGYHSPYNNPRLEDGPEGEYLPDRLVDESIRFLEKHGEEPFFLYLSFYTVHTPIQACQRHLGKFMDKAKALPEIGEKAQRPEGEGFTKTRQDNPAYASMIHAMDENVGRLLQCLERLALTERTVVIFTSDNGGLSTLFRRGYPTSNLPLRAGKGWCYEGGIRVPLIIRCPGITTPGETCAEPVVSMDFYPTLLALAGIEADPGQCPDGESLLPLMKTGEALPRDTLYWHYPHYHGSAWKPGAALRAGPWKLVEFYEEGRAELYNLESDPGESRELSRSEPEKKEELLNRLHAWQKEVGAKMSEPNPDEEGSE